MELSPRSLRSIQESTSSRGLQGQDEISALQQQQLYNCNKEQILLRNNIRVLQDLVDNSGMRLQQLEDGASMNVANLRTCLEEKANKERKSAVLEDAAKDTKEQIERFEMIERFQKEQMERLAAQLESLRRETSVIIQLQRADMEAKTLSKEIENLQMQILEESGRLLPVEKGNISPASENKHSASASSEGM